MSKKSKLQTTTAIAALAMGAALLYGGSVHAATTSGTTLSELQQRAVTEGKNILVYSNNGKISTEYHADGTVVTYQYDSNGKMTESDDNRGYIQKYRDLGDHIEISDYLAGKLLSKKHSAHLSTTVQPMSAEARRILAQKKIDQTNTLQSGTTITPNSTTSYEDYYVNGVLMNDIAVSLPNHSTDYFEWQSTNMSQSSIQNFFVSKNSILQNSVEIYRMDSSGTVYDTYSTILPSQAIYNAAYNDDVNPKVVIATLQKESSLVSAAPGSVSYSSRRFYYAMGYGATDSGDINGTSGFDTQISDGTNLLYTGWLDSPTGSSNYPTLVSPINNGQAATSNGVTYKSYVWVDNYGSWSLYNYTPWTLDTSLLPTISGGNYLFHQIFSGYWGTNWN